MRVTLTATECNNKRMNRNNVQKRSILRWGFFALAKDCCVFRSATKYDLSGITAFWSLGGSPFCLPPSRLLYRALLIFPVFYILISFCSSSRPEPLHFKMPTTEQVAELHEIFPNVSAKLKTY